MNRRALATVLWFSATAFPAIALAQALPGYERTLTDQIHNKDNERLADRAEDEKEGLQALELKAWKDQAICWGQVDFEAEQVRIEFGERDCFRLQSVKLKRAVAEVVAGEPVLLPKPKRPKKLIFTLPDGSRAEHKTVGKGQELFGIFRLNSTQTWACLRRAAS